jgi:hypothetical protein
MVIVSSSAVAAGLSLVIEAKDKEGNHYATYFIASNKKQFYDARNPKDHTHYQLFDWQSTDEQHQLSSKGFQKVDTTEAKSEGVVRSMYQQWHTDGGQKQKYYCVLPNNRNHYLQDVVVINKFDPEDTELLEICSKVDFKSAIRLTLTDPSGATTHDKRANIRRDIGYSTQNSRDGETVIGMNMPKRRKLEVDVKGVKGTPTGVSSDPTFEYSLFMMARLVMMMSDVLAPRHPYPKDELAQRAFVDPANTSILKLLQWPENVGLPADPDHDRFNAASFFVTGEINRRLFKTEKHEDTQNCPDCPRSPTYTEIVTVKHGSDNIQVRGGMNAYNKGGITIAGKKLHTSALIANQVLAHAVSKSWIVPKAPSTWVEMCLIDNQLSLYINMVHCSIKENALSIFFAYSDAGMDRKAARDKFVMESLLSMVMKPTYASWKEAYEIAVGVMCKDHKRILDAFGVMEAMRTSLANLSKTFKEASDSASNTKATLRKMCKSDLKGGITNVGRRWANRLLDAGMKLDVVHNMKHADFCRSVAISQYLVPNVLRNKYEMQNDTHAREIVPYLTGSISKIQDEDECVRWLLDMVPPGENDVVGESAKVLYVIQDGHLCRAFMERKVIRFRRGFE